MCTVYTLYLIGVDRDWLPLSLGERGWYDRVSNLTNMHMYIAQTVGPLGLHSQSDLNLVHVLLRDHTNNKDSERKK